MLKHQSSCRIVFGRSETAQNRRIGKKVNGQLALAFVYQSQTQIAAELDGTGKLLRRFIYGSQSNMPDYMISGGQSYRIISNEIGTPEAVVDSATGKIVSEMYFDGVGGMTVNVLNIRNKILVPVL